MLNIKINLENQKGDNDDGGIYSTTTYTTKVGESERDATISFSPARAIDANKIINSKLDESVSLVKSFVIDENWLLANRFFWTINIYKNNSESKYLLNIELFPQLEYYPYIYSAYDIYNSLVNADKEFHNSEYKLSIDLETMNSDGLYLSYEQDIGDKTLIELCDIVTSHIGEFLERSYKLLENNGALITAFKFPEETKVASKQYLIYFAQFLSDLGIEAETEIGEDAKRTLFKVTPKDKNESLEKIREALNVYLSTPGMTEVANFNSMDVAAHQWKSQILFLQSQIMLNQSAVQLKDAAIQAQDAAIRSLQLTNYQLAERVKQQEEEVQSEEEIVPGVSIKKLDGGWFSLNFPEWIRKLKRKF